MYQTTIQRAITCTGTGLHSGKPVSLVLRPAAEDTGIVFHVTTPEGKRDITATPHVVVATGLATTLGNDGITVSTVEHLLAALRGLSVDNVHVHVQGREIPILDGSAEPFVRLIEEAGVINQNKLRKVLRINSSVSFEYEGKSICAESYNGFFVDYTIDFPHPAIGKQRFALEVTPLSFAAVAASRTFGFLRDVKHLQSRGLALGGNLDNAIVLDDNGVLNQEGLRWADEFVRHKLLDFIGDMAMLPLPLQGKFAVNCSGHSLNNQFLRHAVDNHFLNLVTLAPRPIRSAHAPAAVEIPLGVPVAAFG